MNEQKVYEYALQREHEGRDFFEANAQRMSHAAAKGIFLRLADEEAKHIRFIESLLEGLKKGAPPAPPGPALPSQEPFSSRAESEMLDQTVIESMVPDLPVLRMAYLIERDFAEFYEHAAAQAEGPAKAALTSLAHWERGHERLFKELHDRAFEEYAGMPWGG